MRSIEEIERLKTQMIINPGDATIKDYIELDNLKGRLMTLEKSKAERLKKLQAVLNVIRG